MKKAEYKYENFLIFVCAFLYASSMAAKGIFIAEQKYIVDLWGLKYAEASIANTYYFVLYAFIQVVLFIIISKLDIVKYVLFTVPLAAITTALIGTASKIGDISLFFGISGIFQGGIYCACNYVLTKYLPSELLTKANKIMNAMYAVGTVIAYAICAFFITWDLWRVPYFLIGGIFLFSLVLFGIVVRRFERIKKERKIYTPTKEVDSLSENEQILLLNGKRSSIVFYFFVILFTVLISALYYSIMNYITALLVDVHGMSQNLSIYVSIIAPIAVTFGPIFTINSCSKTQDFIAVGIRYLLYILPVPLLLLFFYDSHFLVAILLSVFFIVIAQGVKTIVLSVIAFQMRNQINVGAYAAITNAVASVSAGVTPMIIGKIIDVSGWKVSYGVIFILIVVIVVALCLLKIFIRRFKQRVNKNQM